MSVLENFKNIPQSPYIGAIWLKSNFFLQICNEVPREKKGGGPVAPPRATNGPGPQARQGGLSPPAGDRGGLSLPPSGDRGMPPYISSNPHLPFSFEPENSTKNPEKKERGEEKGSGEALPDSAPVICRLVHLVYVFFHWYCRVI